jgi:hypothetical protein
MPHSIVIVSVSSRLATSDNSLAASLPNSLSENEMK